MTRSRRSAKAAGTRGAPLIVARRCRCRSCGAVLDGRHMWRCGECIRRWIQRGGAR